MPNLGHVGDPHLMILPAVLLVASKGDVGCGAAHSVSAPRASPLAAMFSSPPPRSNALEPIQKSFCMALTFPINRIRCNMRARRRAMQAVRRGRAADRQRLARVGRLTLARGVQPADAVLVRQRVEDVVEPAWCARGPAAARRAMCRLNPKATSPFSWFDIHYGWHKE